MSNNGSLGGIIDDADFAAFDALPAEIRRAFAEAPYDLAFGDVAGQLAAFEKTKGRPLEPKEIAFAVDAITEEHRFELEVTAFALYGAAHPQARVVSIECLLDLNLLSVSTELKRWRAGNGCRLDPRPDVPVHFKQAESGDHRDLAPLYLPIRRRGRSSKPRQKKAYEPSPKIAGDRVAPRMLSARNAKFDPRRDPVPVHADAAAALMGDPPIGRRAIDQIRR